MPAKLQPLTLKAEAGAIPITEEQFKRYLSPDLAELRGDLTTYGPWQIPVRHAAPAASYVFSPNGWADTVTLYGPRTLTALKESGYCLEGKVSVGGKKRRGFTSGQLWQLPDGRLIETALIHTCL